MMGGPRSSRRPPPRGDQVEPAVLVVGATEAFLAALSPALQRHHVAVETCTAEHVLESVIAAAPDLVLLAGDTAREGGTAVLERLAESPHTSVIPVALLGDDRALESRLKAFRHGAAAVIPKSASIDAIAERIASLAREIPERGGSALGDVGEATLHELVDALSKELRTGILTVQTPGADEQEAVRLVLGAGRPLSDAIDDFVSRVRRHIVVAEPLKYEFDERAGGTVTLLGADEAVRRAEKADTEGLRILLADDDTARADAVTQELRSRGITVVVTDLDPGELRFGRLRQLDPAILLIGEKQAQGVGYELMRRMRRDTRLRWSALLVVRWNEVWTEQSTVPAIERIISTLASLAEPERSLCARADAGVAFDTRLEITGPSRLLRALVEAKRAVRLTVQNPRVVVQVDLSDGLIAGATAQTLTEPVQELAGATALAALAVLSSGRVHVAPTEQPRTANVMATVDVALNMADAEPPPIAPSMPAPARRADARRSIAKEPEEVPEVAAAPDGLAADFEKVKKDLRKGRTPASMPRWVLYAFAALQPFVVLGLLLSLRPEGSPEATAASAVPVANASASAAASASMASATPASSHSAQPAAPAQEAKPEVADGSSKAKAPTCTELLTGFAAPGGVYPGAAFGQLRAGRRALVRGDLDEAQRAYCRALRLDPRNLSVHVDFARLLLLRRDGEAAMDAAKGALKLVPGDRGALLALGDGLALTGRLVDAREPLMRGSGVEPNDEISRGSLMRNQMALALRAERRRERALAERFYRRAFVLEPSSAAAAAGVARVLLAMDEHDAAVVWAKRSVELDANAVVYRVLLGDALNEAGDSSEARTAWKQAAALDPRNPEARARLAGR